ncbi:hypothetical protein SprV_0602201100 [Sparganum proliferum]
MPPGGLLSFRQAEERVRQDEPVFCAGFCRCPILQICVLEDRPGPGLPSDPIDREDVSKTAATTPIGLFEPLYIPQRFPGPPECFLDMIYFCCRFLLNCADIILQPTDLLSGPKLSPEPSADAVAAFNRVKAILADATFLTKSSPAEPRYSTLEWALLAVYLAMKHFRHFTEDRDFTAFSDHKPLSSTLKFTCDKLNPREIHQLHLRNRQFTQ